MVFFQAAGASANTSAIIIDMRSKDGAVGVDSQLATVKASLLYGQRMCRLEKQVGA